MRKFKVGQKVYVLNISERIALMPHVQAKNPVPYQCEILEVDPDDGLGLEYKTKHPLSGEVWWIKEEHLSPIDFKPSLSEILEVQHAAVTAIDARMWGALKSGAHAEGEWKREPVEQHALRAAKHILTAVELIRNLDRTSDETAREHVQAAVTRCAMLLANLEAGR